MARQARSGARYFLPEQIIFLSSKAVQKVESNYVAGRHQALMTSPTAVARLTRSAEADLGLKE